MTIKNRDSVSVGGFSRDAKSPLSGGRLPFLDVNYCLPYGRTYLPFSPFTYGASGGDRHTHAGIGFDTCILLIGSLARWLSDCLLLLVLGEATRSCCLTAKCTFVYLFMQQLSCNLVMCKTLYDSKHGKCEWQKWKRLGNVCKRTKLSTINSIYC